MDITIYYHVVEHEQLGARLVAAKIEPKRYQLTASAKECASFSLVGLEFDKLSFHLKPFLSVFCYLSFENSDDDNPDCSGGPKFLKSKHKGVFTVPYTYSVSFVVSKLSSHCF